MVRLDCLEKEKMQCHSQTVSHGRRHGETRLPGKRKKCSVTHILLVMGGDMMRLDCLQEEQMQCHSLSVGHGRGHGETRLPGKKKKCSVTHKLLVIGGDMVRLDCLAKEKSAVTLTSCWSWEDLETW